MPTSKFSVQLNCGNCVGGVTDAIKDALGDKVAKVDCDLQSQVVTVEHSAEVDAVLQAIKDWTEEVDHKAPTKLE